MKKMYVQFRFAILCVLSVLGLSLFAPRSASAQCITSWAYFNPDTITNGNTVPLTNFQVKIVFNSAALITAGQMNIAGNDIRFLDSACNNLQYWIESGINTAVTTIWVKVNYIPAGGRTIINMYYDNAAAPAVANGDSTFMLFDDFNTGSLNAAKWTTSGTGALPTFSGSDVTITTTGVVDRDLISVARFDTSFYSEMKVDTATGSWPNLAQLDSVGAAPGYNSGTTMFGNMASAMYIGPTTAGCGAYSAFLGYSTAISTKIGIWSMVRERGMALATWPGGSITAVDSAFYSPIPHPRFPTATRQYCAFGLLCGGTGSLSVDWFRVRRYAPVVPNVGYGPQVPNFNLVTGTISPTTLCSGNPLLINFSKTGNYLVGNVFTTQLSDSTGSFASPVIIGSEVDTAAIPLIATIPFNTPHGTGYRIRVVSNSPFFVAADNGTNLTINPTPTVTPVSNQVQCNSNLTIPINFTSSVGGTTYTWTNSNTAIGTAGSGTGNIASFTATDAGATSISGAFVVSPTANSCPGPTATFTITVNPSPNAGTITGSSSVCTSTDITLSDGSAGGVWSMTNGHAVITAGGIVAGLSAGNDTAVYTFTNSCGTATTSTTVVVNASPYAGSISGSSDVCVLGTTTLSDGAVGGTWSAVNGNATVSAGGVVTGVATGTDTIKYTVTSGCGTAITYIIVTINPLIIAGPISGSSTVCAGSSFSLTDPVAGGSWSATNGSASVLGGNVTGISAGIDTILYTVSNICGISSASITLTVSPMPVAGSISGLSSVCTGSNLTLTDPAGGGSGIWSMSNPDATVAGGVITPVSVGTDSVLYSVSNSCGTAIANKLITITSLPSAGTVLGLTSVCAGSAITLADGVAGGAWSASNTNATVSGGIVSGITSGTDSIIYTVTNGCGATTAFAIITINPLPLAGTITGSSSVCVSSTITLTDPAGGGGGSWSANNTHALVSGTGAVTGYTTGIDTIQYTVRNTCGVATATTTVTVDPLPNAGTVTGTSVVCATYTIALSDPAVGGVWSASNGNATVVGGVVTGVTAGTDSIKYTVSNTCGIAVAYEVVTINPLPVAGSITGSSSVCAGSVTTLTDAASGGIWTATNGHAIVSGTGVVNGITSGTDTIIYSVSNSCGIATTSATVAIDPLPNAGSITGTSVVCATYTIALSDLAGGGIWSASNGNATVTGGVVTGVAAGTDSIKYTVSNSCGTAVVYEVVTINPLPAAGSITGSSSVCAGSSISLTDAASGGIWTATNAHAIVTGIGVVAGITTGIDTIKYSVTNSCGTATTTATVTVNPLPNAGSITGTSAVCATYTIALTDATGGGTWSASNGNATVSGGVVTGVTAGTDSIKYSVSNSCGTAMAYDVVIINPLPNAGSITGSSSVCAGSAVTLTDAASGGFWSATNTHAIAYGVGIFSGNTAGIDTIIYSVTNSCGTATVTHTLTIGVMPTAGVITGTTVVCAGSNITLTDAAPGGLWSVSNGHASVTSGVVTGITAGTDSIIYTVSNGCGVAMQSVVVTINPLPVAGTITGIFTVCAGSNVTLSGVAGGGLWSTTNTHAIVTSAGVVIGNTSGEDTIMYSVSNSCGIVTDSAMITVNPLPNAGVISGASLVCAGSNDTLTNIITGGVWSASNGHATVSGGVVTAIAAGIDTMMYTDSNSCGIDVASLTVTILPLPNAGSIGGFTAICTGSSNTLTDAAAGGLWTATNGNAIVSGTGVINAITTGMDSIIYTVSNSCGIAADTSVITINALLSAGSITGASAVCAGSNITLSDATTGGTWSASNGHATVIGGVVAGITAGTDSIMYADTNSCGTAIAYKIVTINPMPLAGSISGASAVCMGSVITLTDAATGGVWTATNGNVLVSSTGIVAGFTAGIDTVNYTVSNGCGTVMATYSVTVNIMPNAGTIIGPASTVCIGNQITLLDASFAGAWGATNGNATVSGGTITGGVVTGVTAGTDNIFYAVNNSCGVDTAFYMVTVNPSPNAGSITGSTAVCAGSVISLIDAMSGGVWTTTNGIALVSGSGVVEGLTAGMDTIVYSVTNSCGTATVSTAVTVNPLPNAGTITGMLEACIFNTDTLTDAATGGMWYSSNPNDTISGGVVVGYVPGLDTISYTVSNSCGADTVTYVININDVVSPTVVRSDSTLTATAGYATYQWYNDTTLIPGATNPSIYVTDTGNYYVVVTTAAGCYGASTITSVFNLSVGNVNAQGDVNIYPNPAQNNIVITAFQLIHKVSITDLVGQTVFSDAYNDNKVEISMANLPSGVYMVKINDTNVYRIVKE